MAAPRGFRARVNDFCFKLEFYQIEGSLEIAKRTTELLRQLVSSSRISDPLRLLDEVRSVGCQMQAARPTELVIGNVVRRVLHVIREEMEAEQEEQDDDLPQHASGDFGTTPSEGGLSRALRGGLTGASRAHSLHNLLDQGIIDAAAAAAAAPVSSGATTMGSSGRAAGAATAAPAAAQRGGVPKGGRQAPQWDRKQEVLEGVGMLVEELRDIDRLIAEQALDHIHANEVILTWGYSRTVLEFMKRAREKRDFQVVVAEAAPTYGGLRMAKELSAAGLHTTLISDAAIFAMMARVNKVVVGAHALLADGGMMVPVGVRVVAMAARRHAVPVVALCGMYKLTPLFAHEPGLSFNELRNPADLLPFTHEANVQTFLSDAHVADNVLFPVSDDEEGEGNQGTPPTPSAAAAGKAAGAGAAAEAAPRPAAAAAAAAADVHGSGSSGGGDSSSEEGGGGGFGAGRGSEGDRPAPVDKRSYAWRRRTRVLPQERVDKWREYYKRDRPTLLVENPAYDYVPPDLISLYLTDHGRGFMPSYVYRQLSEFYRKEDYELAEGGPSK